jgi:transcriptional regulator with GAF, ATPase, and Fis domain
VTPDGRPDAERPTVALRGQAIYVRQFAVAVVDGPDRGARVESRADELAIGTSDGNDLQLTDAGVSRHHCALRAGERGLELADLGSRNGTFVGDVEVQRAVVRSGARIRIGKTTLELAILDRELEQPLAAGDRLGPLLGGSPAMRRLYPLIEQCGRSAATVLVTGETGTGKELIAEAIHAASERRDQPFVVVDCSALSHDLAESELFGHERGAFTGADVARVGAFEAADGGTVFLDEIGELPLALQPLLLRVLENRTIRRVGSNDHRGVDVRVVAASHRDLRAEVNAKRFRADLFYRLNVLRVGVPPLRERAGDVAVLTAQFWSEYRADAPPAGLVDHLAGQRWPGNVRELRNAVERAALLGWKPDGAAVRVAEDALSYQQAKERAVWEWERGWVQALVSTHGGNLSRAARAARMGRSNLREVARRHGVIAAAAGEPADDEE